MKYILQDLIDIDHFQDLQNKLNEIYSFPSAIIDNDGNILTATAWQDICVKFHRKNRDCEKECIKSDQYILSHLHEANPAVSYRCPHGLVDNATPIIVDGVHYGNFFTGQFFLEKPDLNFFRTQAKKYGFEEDAYLEAVKKVPVWSQEQLNSYLYFIKGLIAIISDSGLKKLREIETRKQIEESEEHANAILSQMHDGFWIVSLEGGQVIDANEAMCRMVGYTRDELLTMSVSDVEADASPEVIAERIRHTVQTGSAHFESRFRCKNGAFFDVESSITYLPKRKLFFGFHRNITERKRAEETLRESDSRLENIIYSMADWVWEVDKHGFYTFSSQKSVDILERSSEEVIGKTPFDFMPPDEAQRVGEIFSGIAARKEPIRDLENWNITKNGARICLLTNGVPILDDKGNLEGYRGVDKDITERKQAEERLKKQQYYLEKAQELGRIGTWEIEIAINKLYWTDENCRIFGVPAGTVVNYEIFFEKVHPDDREYVDHEWNAALAGKPYDIEHRIVVDGAVKWVREKADVEFNKEGIAYKAIGFTQDITERKQTEESLKDSKLFLDNLTDIAYMTDNQGHVTWTNPAIKKITGFSPEEVVGKPFLPLFVEKNHASLIEVYKRTLMGESLENTLTFTSGVTCHFSSLPRRNSAGKIIGTFGTARDITDRLRAEKEIQDSEERFRAAFMTSPDSININRNSDGMYLDINEGFTNILGYTREDCIGESSLDIPIWDDPKDRERLVAGLKENGFVNNMEARFRAKDGSFRIGLMSARMILLNGQQHILSVTRDITERKMAEIQLRESRDLLNNLASLVPGVVYQYRLYTDGRSAFPYSSPGMNDIYEVTPEEVREDATLVFGRLHPDDYNHVAGLIQESARTLKTFYCEFRVILPRQGLRWRWSQAQPERTSDGGTLWHGIISDITGRKLAEADKERLTAAIEQAGEVVVITNTQGTIQYVNPSFERVTGYSREEVIGQNPRILKGGNQNITFYRDMWETISSGNIWRGRFTNKRKDGAFYTEDATISPVLDSAGNIINYVAVKNDITAQLLLEQQLTQAQKMESVGRLAGGVAHDFNNMLGVILGHTELALEQIDPAQPLHADLREIQKAAKRSADLTRQLLAFARKQTVAPKVLDLNGTVESMLKMLKRLIGEDIDLVWRPCENIWPVKMDPSQIDQILANLCVNARDAIDGVGKVTIETGTTVFDEDYGKDHAGYIPGEYVLLAVSDNGCGMSKETLDKLFEPFFTTKETGKGTGLGLATIYGIVKQNDGFINVYSELDHGTTFKIYLPRHISTASQPQTEGAAELTLYGHETILLVEDEPSNLAMTTRILDRLGYTVLTTNSPGEAISLAKEHAGKIQLLITDVIMPEMNGRDLASILFRLYPKLKLMFMSGYTANVIAHHGVLDEGIHFIQKPFTIKELAAKIREVLDT